MRHFELKFSSLQNYIYFSMKENIKKNHLYWNMVGCYEMSPLYMVWMVGDSVPCSESASELRYNDIWIQIFTSCMDIV